LRREHPGGRFAQPTTRPSNDNHFSYNVPAHKIVHPPVVRDLLASWGPVGQGYLTRKIDAGTKFDPKMDMRSAFPRFSPENITANSPIVDFLRRIAEKKSAKPAQISLAWLLAQKPWIVPIPGTRNTDHLNENLEAVNVQLTPADLREIDTAFSKITVHGGRMNEAQMKVVDQTT
jgi:diketogulonate reductase-like aldo/keto reductase